MLEEKDFKKIGEEVGKLIEQNVMPAFDSLDNKINNLREELKGEIGEMRGEIGEIKAAMVTKSYLDDKLADLEGSIIVRQRKEDKKVGLLIEILREKAILTESDAKMLGEIQVFPTLPKNF